MDKYIHVLFYFESYRALMWQKWFAMRFLGQDSDINIDTEIPEFSKWRWTDPALIVQQIVPFKRSVYTAVLEEFTPLLP